MAADYALSVAKNLACNIAWGWLRWHYKTTFFTSIARYPLQS